MNKFLLSTSLLLSCIAVKAQTYSSTGSVSIADGSVTCGTDATPGVSSISVPLTATIVTPSAVTINVNLTHAFVGDLRVELVAPDASVCILMNHIGATVCEGTGSTASGANTLSFNSSFATPVPTGISPVPSGNYAPTGSTAFPAVGNLATFLSGKSVNGTWSLRAIDNYAPFVGTIDAWNIDFGASALPLEILSFTGSAKGNFNNLHWASGKEENISSIELERNSDGNRFEKISTFNPQGSYSHYEHNDPIRSTGVVLYRLKIKENDGTASYSPVLRLHNSGSVDAEPQLTPNPVKGFVELHLGNEELKGSSAQLMNAMGATLAQFNINSNQQRIDMSTYPEGVYFIKLDNGTILRFVKVN